MKSFFLVALFSVSGWGQTTSSPQTPSSNSTLQGQSIGTQIQANSTRTQLQELLKGNATITGNPTFTGNVTFSTITGNPTFTGNVTFNGPVNILGITNGSTASAGFVGEYISSTPAANVAPGSFGNYVPIAAINISSGDWQITACALWQAGTSANVTQVAAGISLNSTSLDNGLYTDYISYNGGSGNVTSCPPPRRINTSSNKTVYLIGESNYGTLGTMVWNGQTSIIQANRVR
ncbi:MAG: hypothetical protein KGI58_04145 [Patescibacteria group bacterium]|nr:hypothetical protein [Patescibacteria group bacterium]